MGRAECDVMHKTADSKSGSAAFILSCPICPRFSDLSGLSGNGRFVRNVRIVREWSICPDCPKKPCYYHTAGISNPHCEFSIGGNHSTGFLLPVLNGSSAPSASSPSGAYHSFEVSTVDTFFFCRSETPGGFFIPPGSAKVPLPSKRPPPPGMTRRGKGSRSFEDHRTARQQKEAAS